MKWNHFSFIILTHEVLKLWLEIPDIELNKDESHSNEAVSNSLRGKELVLHFIQW